MLRLQFSMRALLLAVLVVAAFFGGMALQRQLDKPRDAAIQVYPLIGPAKLITLPNGTKRLQQVFQPITIEEYKAMVADADQQAER